MTRDDVQLTGEQSDQGIPGQTAELSVTEVRLPASLVTCSLGCACSIKKTFAQLHLPPTSFQGALHARVRGGTPETLIFHSFPIHCLGNKLKKKKKK